MFPLDVLLLISSAEKSYFKFLILAFDLRSKSIDITSASLLGLAVIYNAIDLSSFFVRE